MRYCPHCNRREYDCMCRVEVPDTCPNCEENPVGRWDECPADYDDTEIYCAKCKNGPYCPNCFEVCEASGCVQPICSDCSNNLVMVEAPIVCNEHAVQMASV